MLGAMAEAPMRHVPTLLSLIASSLILASGSLAAAAPTPSSATDIKLKKPNALLLVDTSGSMLWGLDGADASCVLGRKGRWAMLAEAMTGTVNNLQCSSSVALQSNDCRPYLNGESDVKAALKSHPEAWPQHVTQNPDQKDAVVFCGLGAHYANCRPDSWLLGRVCKQKVGEWDQSADGLLDTFAKQMRFGLMTFDSLSVIPYPTFSSDGHRDPAKWLRPFNMVKGDTSYGAPDGCQLKTDGSVCLLSSSYTFWRTNYADTQPQWSYWYGSDLDSWVYGGRSGLEENIVSVDFSGLQQLIKETYIDIGARNPNAPPTAGRLIGFGPSDWDTNAASVTGCATEEDCTKLHNEMVQKAVLGVSQSLEHSTPLAALLRDAYQFIRFDKGTVGVHLPHAATVDPSKNAAVEGKIGPALDPYTTGGCRDTAVILLTDGNPTQDVAQKPAYYAGKLFAETGTKTFVVGIALDSAKWSSTGAINSEVAQDCSALTSADFAAGRMCEPHPTNALAWKYAELPYATALSGAEPERIQACCELLQTAVQGGTNKPFFPKDQSSLKQELNKVLSNVAGGTVSRTVPVFAAPASTYLSAGGTPNAPASYFEIRSSMEVTSGDTLWRGHLERVRYQCDSKSGELVPTAQTVTTSKGDRFEDNLDASAPTQPRRFFTVVPLDPTGSFTTADLRGSLRSGAATANRADSLFRGGRVGDFKRFGNAASSSTDKLVTAPLIASTITALSGTPKLQDVLGLTVSDTTSCSIQTGSSTLATCADRVLRWYGGEATPGGATVSRAASSAQCPSGYCSSFGGVYRTSPVIVPPPEAKDSDDSDFSGQGTGTSSFVRKYGTRPSMVYSQTVDGQLHAFTLAMNDFDKVDPDFDAPEVRATDKLDNNELWSFVPPAVVPSLWPSFNVHARLTDGQLAWSNVVFERDVSSGAPVSARHEYRTVLVAASGPSAIGAFYYALDITDPLQPRFLWQLSSAGNGTKGAPGDSLFGTTAPGAAITHVRYKEADGTVKLLAAAILPGGAGVDSLSTGVRNRRMDPFSYWTGFSRRPRAVIRDHGPSVPARSLTVVELSTGRILGRLTGEMGDNPRDPSKPSDLGATVLSSRVVVPSAQTAFDSPITGIPVAYPSGYGAVAQRVYVGDADGTMWRIDLSNADPTKWTARIAFDSYNTGAKSNATLEDAWIAAGPRAGSRLSRTGTTTQVALMGQPIQTAPLLSLDTSGNVVVTYSTGDQESFNAVTPGMLNLLVSFADAEAGSGYRALMSSDTGVELAFEEGARVTGAVNLFDSQLYFAYFVPAEGLACSKGHGGLCGVDYQHRQEFVPIGAIDLDGAKGVDRCVELSDDEVVFGVSIHALPSCTDDKDIPEETFKDRWLGGKYEAQTQSNVGRFQLAFHTGQGGTTHDGAVTKSATIALPTPKTRVFLREVSAEVE